MTRTPWFESPFLLGFERLQEMAERAASLGSDGYPPYNIEDVGEDHLRVTLAVAGFELDELNVELNDRYLVLTGEKRDESDARAYLHRGIAARRFRRTFLLADGCDVEGATLEHGLLHIDVRVHARAPEVTRIAIRSSGASGA